MPKHDTAKKYPYERLNIMPEDRLILDSIRGQLSKMLGRRLTLVQFAGLIAKYGDKIRDLIAENEKVE